MMAPKKIYISSYGCSANTAGAEVMKGLLAHHGFQLVSSHEESDLNIINTCIVKRPTEHRMIYRIRELRTQGKPLIVAGCMPKAEPEILKRICPEASLLGPASVEKIVEAAIATLQGRRVVELEDYNGSRRLLPRVRRNPLVGIVEIASGCLGACTYCIVRYARGRLRSHPIASIVEEVKQALREGCKELWLTSQDTACYGIDRGVRLPELLDRVCAVEGDFLVRVGMMNPFYAEGMVEDLINSFRDRKVFKFLHLPIQSASPRLLKLMGRGYSPETPLEIIGRFRHAFPELSLSTDVIVGFPTEEEDDFQETLSFLKKVEPDVVNVSKYGARPRTPASKMKDLPSRVVKERCRVMMETVRELTLRRNRRWLGWRGPCLIDEKAVKGDGWMGRNPAYKPLVIASPKPLLGKIVHVEVVDATNTYLRGEIIQN